MIQAFGDRLDSGVRSFPINSCLAASLPAGRLLKLAFHLVFQQRRLLAQEGTSPEAAQSRLETSKASEAAKV